MGTIGIVVLITILIGNTGKGTNLHDIGTQAHPMRQNTTLGQAFVAHVLILLRLSASIVLAYLVNRIPATSRPNGTRRGRVPEGPAGYQRAP